MSERAFSVRTATTADAAEVAAVYNQAVIETTSTLDLVTRSVEEQASWIRERSGAYCVVVAVAHEGDARGSVIGFASISPYKPRAAYNTTVEDSVYVSPTWGGRGVGRALLSDVINRARVAGFHTVIARIEASSTASRGLHEACGFRLVGVEREVGRKFRRWLDMAVMQLMLNPAEPDADAAGDDSEDHEPAGDEPAGDGPAGDGPAATTWTPERLNPPSG